MRAPGEVPEAEASDLLHVRLFGGFEVARGDGAVVPVESGRMRSLLGFLIVNGGLAHPRQHVAFALWPDSTESQARTNLRKLLHTLRSDHPTLAPWVTATNATLCWRREGASIDVVSFEEALTGADARDRESPESLALLRHAVDLYRGDLLDGCHDEWALETRERTRESYLSALRRLVDALLERGEANDAVDLARRLVRADPYREDSHRLLMRAQAAAGDRAAAVRAYHECVSTLQRELGVEPSAETAALYATLTGPVDQPAPGDHSAPRRPGRLVGRQDEWDLLTQSWLAAESGTPALVVVTGEPGIGKTRLVEEVATWAGHRGAVVAQGQAYASGGDLAYGMASSWLRREPLATVVSRAAASVTTDLAVLLPELSPAPAAPGGSSDARRRVIDAMARLLADADRPVLLVADDAHWCDAPTLEMVHHLVRRTPPLRLLVVATVRNEEVDLDHPLAAVSDDLARADRLIDVGLARISRDDTAVLLHELLDDDVHPTHVDEVHVEAEGNPLFVVELVRAGRLRRVSPDALPTKLHAVIDDRLRRLGSTARDVTGLAATVGRAFSTELLRTASGLADDALAAALDELWRRGVIREQSGDTYDFTHGKIREVAYGSLGPASRRRHHVVVAEALQRVHGRAADAVSSQVALHYDRAGRVVDALAWYVRAARQAQRMYADGEAVRLLERARALVDEVPADNRLAQELEVLTAMPAALVALDGFASARLAAVQQRALDLATRLGVEPDPVLLRSRVMSGLSGRDFDAASDAAVRLARAAADRNDDALAVEGDYLLGISAFWGGRLGDARRHFEAVVERFDSARRDEHLVRFGHDPSIVCLSRLGNTLFFLGDDDGARRARDDAVAMARRLAHPYSRGAAHAFGMLLAIDLGDTAIVNEYLDAMGREPAHGPTALLRDAAAGYAAVVDGDVDGGLRLIGEALSSSGGVDSAPGQVACLLRIDVAAHEAAGDPVRGLPAVDEALAAPGSRLWEAEIRRVRAELLAIAGRPPADVSTELDAAAAVAARQGAAGLVRRLAASRARLLGA